MRFAEHTAVSSERSKAEIEETLRRYGADQFMSGWREQEAAVQFRIKDKMVRFILPLPDTADFKTRIDGRTKSPRALSPEDSSRYWEQACRQRWRALALAIKAKLEAVECGITTFEEEFLAHIVVPGMGGKTVGQLMLKRLDDAYANGKAPALSWDGGKS
jgi:hypothetical protein